MFGFSSIQQQLIQDDDQSQQKETKEQVTETHTETQAPVSV